MSSTQEAILRKVFYSAGGFQRNAIQLREAVLRKGKDLSKNEIQEWLDKQAMYQILFKPKPKFIRVPRFMVSKPNDIHQADLLFLPHDEICIKLRSKTKSKSCKTYKYTLSIIDIASRYKAAVPLETKSAEEVSKAFISVYNDKKNPLTWPRLLQVDAGGEFKGMVTKLMTNNKVKFERGEPGNHKSQSLVESLNRALAKHIFPHQYSQEMKYEVLLTKLKGKTKSVERNREWVKLLPSIVLKLNETKTSLINMKPKHAIKLSTVEVLMSNYKGIPVAPNEKIIDLDSLVRYLYAPGELEGGNVKRATDPIWSIHSYEIKEVMEIEKQPLLYYLQEFNNHTPPKRSFVREELQIIPRDTESPP